MPIVKLFLDICLFRKGPQDVPLSKPLLTLTLIFALMASTLISLMEVGFFRLWCNQLVQPCYLSATSPAC